MKVIELNRQPVELYKILKFEGLVDNGGEAKAVIADGRVLVNGAVETLKRKKIVSGDVIEFGSLQAQVLYVPPNVPPMESAAGEVSYGKAAQTQAATRKTATQEAVTKKGAAKKIATKKVVARKAVTKKSTPGKGTPKKGARPSLAPRRPAP